MTDHLTRFKGPPGVDPYAVSTEQERIAVAFEQRGLDTDLSRKMLLVIQGQGTSITYSRSTPSHPTHDEGAAVSQDDAEALAAGRSKRAAIQSCGTPAI